MKKIVLMTVIAAAISGSAFAGKGEENINKFTVEQFQEDFPQALNTNWIRESNFSKVSFLQGGVSLTAYYGYDSNLMGVMEEETASSLPEKGLRKLEEHYPDYTIKEVVEYKDNEANSNDALYFYEPLHEADSYFAEISNDKHTIIVQILPDGELSFFKKLN